MDYKNNLLKNKIPSSKIDCNTLINITNDMILKITLETINDKNVLQEWIRKDSRAKKLIYEIDVTRLLELDIEIPEEIINDSQFPSYLFNSILKKTESLIDIRSYIHKIKDKNYEFGNKLSSELNKYYNEIVSSYNPTTGLFKTYTSFINDSIKENDSYLFSKQLKNEISEIKDENQLVQKFKLETSLKLSEIIIDSIFEDNIYNVKLNIAEMLRYLDSIDDKILDDEKISFYKMIANIDKIDNTEKIKLYNALRNKNISSLLYDDLRNLKNHSYNAIADCLTNFNDNESLKSIELSKKHGVDIYELNGEKFYMLVKSMNPISDKENINNILGENNKTESLIDRGCYSLISSDDISVFSKKFVYGFYNFNIDNIISVFEKDCFSRENDGENDERILNENYGTIYVNRIMTPSQIVNGLKTERKVGYSEIQIAEELKPDFIVAFDEVNDLIINDSKRLSIPVVIINTEKYKNDKKRYNPANDETLMYIDFTSDRESYLRGKR